ncbi:hypothetical protein D5086_001102 [Populus alba]|uniref:Uncharacterized protein n=1 Tax=Populus alba TaxID=43335 RepID=A0ACC4CXP3_POPAL
MAEVQEGEKRHGLIAMHRTQVTDAPPFPPILAPVRPFRLCFVTFQRGSSLDPPSLQQGTVFGVYVAQNYNVPNVRKITNTGLLIANHIEETYRKPKKRDGDD